jgi:hypothetical protein
MAASLHESNEDGDEDDASLIDFVYDLGTRLAEPFGMNSGASTHLDNAPSLAVSDFIRSDRFCFTSVMSVKSLSSSFLLASSLSIISGF